MGEIDGVRISFDERLDDEEHRLLQTEEADDDEEDGEREPPVEISDGAEERGDSSVGDTVLVGISSGFGIVFDAVWDWVCDWAFCSKVFRSSDTFGYVNDSDSEGVRAEIAETVVNELVVIVAELCNACERSVVTARARDGRLVVLLLVLNSSIRF